MHLIMQQPPTAQRFTALLFSIVPHCGEKVKGRVRAWRGREPWIRARHWHEETSSLKKRKKGDEDEEDEDEAVNSFASISSESPE